MCGIIGYLGKKNAAEEVYCGLERLEYRGYDSAGAAVIAADGKICAVKKQGRVENLKPYLRDIAGAIGIGHTRWATHGRPCDKNAHPHLCGGLALVHNGIIENYAALKAELVADGEEFLSETDSEVIVRLLKGILRAICLPRWRGRLNGLKARMRLWSYARALTRLPWRRTEAL